MIDEKKKDKNDRFLHVYIVLYVKTLGNAIFGSLFSPVYLIDEL